MEDNSKVSLVIPNKEEKLFKATVLIRQIWCVGYISLVKLLEAVYFVKQFKCMALLHFQLYSSCWAVSSTYVGEQNCNVDWSAHIVGIHLPVFILQLSQFVIYMLHF